MEYKKMEIPDGRQPVGTSQPAAATAAPINQQDRKRLIHLAQLVGLLLLAYFAYTGALSHLSDSIGGQYVDGVNRSYIQTAGEHAEKLVEVLSAIKAIVALLASSKGGVSFIIDIEVQLGQALVSIYDMVNYAWLFSIAALVATKLLALLLDLSRLSMAPLVTLFFCCMGLWFGLKSRLPSIAGILSEVARLLLFVVVLVHVVVPLTIYGVASTSQHLFEAHKKEAHSSFKQIHDSLPKSDTGDSLHGQVESGIKHFQDMRGTLSGTAAKLTELTAKHIVLVLGEYLIVPLLLLAALVLLSWIVLQKAWSRIQADLPAGALDSK